MIYDSLEQPHRQQNSKLVTTPKSTRQCCKYHYSILYRTILFLPRAILTKCYERPNSNNDNQKDQRPPQRDLWLFTNSTLDINNILLPSSTATLHENSVIAIYMSPNSQWGNMQANPTTNYLYKQSMSVSNIYASSICFEYLRIIHIRWNRCRCECWWIFQIKWIFFLTSQGKGN